MDLSHSKSKKHSSSTLSTLRNSKMTVQINSSVKAPQNSSLRAVSKTWTTITTRKKIKSIHQSRALNFYSATEVVTPQRTCSSHSRALKSRSNKSECLMTLLNCVGTLSSVSGNTLSKNRWSSWEACQRNHSHRQSREQLITSKSWCRVIMGRQGYSLQLSHSAVAHLLERQPRRVRALRDMVLVKLDRYRQLSLGWRTGEVTSIWLDRMSRCRIRIIWRMRSERGSRRRIVCLSPNSKT